MECKQKTQNCANPQTLGECVETLNVCQIAH